MIDRERRKLLAYHLRHLSTGLISNDEFEGNLSDDVTNGWLPEQYYRSKQAKFDDPIIIPMLELCWGLYSDHKNYKLRDKEKLNDQSLKIIAHCILFLHSEKDYEWPYFDTTINFSLRDFINMILTLCLSFRNKRIEREQSFKEFQKLGDYKHWPFFREEDYTEQLNNKPFLNLPIKTPLLQ